jgi:hypothetical protein
MAELVYQCPRCHASKVTFDVWSGTAVSLHMGWQTRVEAFCICRHCDKSSVMVIREKHRDTYQNIVNNHKGFAGFKHNINDLFDIDGYISLKDNTSISPPEHLPEDIQSVFEEGATCMAVGCFNAAGTMFRLCLDLATKSFLPEDNSNGLNSKIRRNLGFRMPWLFEHGHLPKSLEGLASCVKEDGNDGAHEGTLEKADAEDLLDFTVAVLERLYTEPARVRIATERRAVRRQSGG